MDFNASEIYKLNIDLVALTETKKKEKDTENIGAYLHLFTGVLKGRRWCWAKLLFSSSH